MAQVQRIDFIDDWDGKPVDLEELNKVTFSVNGVEYRMDLRTDNYDKFLKDMTKWSDKAERVGRVSRKPGAAVNNAEKKAELAAIREWAEAQGLEYPKRGRIPLALCEAYEAAH